MLVAVVHFGFVGGGRAERSTQCELVKLETGSNNEPASYHDHVRARGRGVHCGALTLGMPAPTILNG